MMSMNPYFVKSVNIISVGYDEEKELLKIEFKLEIIYHYYGVPMGEFVSFLKTDDIDHYFFNFIANRYHYDEIRKDNR